MTVSSDLPKHLDWADDSVPGIRRRKSGSGFAYIGPDGKPVSVDMRARIKALAVPPAWTGQVLFQYVGDDEKPCPVSSTDVNEYLRVVTGLDVTAKDFRTWMGTLLAAVAFVDLDPPESERIARRAITGVVEEVASHLGNTPAVCRASYVHPTIIESFSDGSLPQRWEKASARGSRHLLADERRLLVLLRPPRRRRQPDCRAA